MRRFPCNPTDTYYVETSWTDLQMDSLIPQSLLRSSKDLKHRKPCVKPLLPQRTILDLFALFYLQVTVFNPDLTEIEKSPGHSSAI